MKEEFAKCIMCKSENIEEKHGPLEINVEEGFTRYRRRCCDCKNEWVHTEYHAIENNDWVKVNG